MGHTADDAGALTATPEPSTQSDLQAAYDRAERIGGLMTPGTRQARLNLTPSQTKVGWIYPETDTGAVMIRTASGWEPLQRSTTSRYVRPTATDSTVDSGTSVGLIDGTIAAARPGQYLIVVRASLYATSSTPVVGWVYAEAQSGSAGAVREEARWDLSPVGQYPTSPTVQFVHNHTAGDLRVTAGYRRASGSFAVTGQGSGLSVVTATFLGRAS